MHREDKVMRIITPTVVLAVAYSSLAFAFFTTLIQVNEKLAILSVLGLSTLLAGVALGNLLHAWVFENETDFNSVLLGLMGVALIALAQLPAMLVGASIYGLSTISVGTRVVFLTAQAVAEEFFFAGFVFYAIYKLNGGFWVQANIATAVIFTVFHWAVYSQHELVLLAVFLSRLILNFLYLRGGLTASITAHAAVNFLAGVI